MRVLRVSGISAEAPGSEHPVKGVELLPVLYLQVCTPFLKATGGLHNLEAKQAYIAM